MHTAIKISKIPYFILLHCLFLLLTFGCTRYARMRSAAESGDPQKMYEFALFLLEKRPKNFYTDADEGLVWLRMSAKKGHVNAMKKLGNVLETYNFGSNDQEALFWFTQAAETGDRQSMDRLANAYRFSQLGLTKDEAKAAYWERRFHDAGEEEQWGATRQKAQAGDSQSMRALGGRAEAFHTEEGNREAVTWYTRAAEAGDRDARMRLANAFGNGELGLKKDPDKSHFWFNKWQESMRAEKKR